MRGRTPVVTVDAVVRFLDHDKVPPLLRGQYGKVIAAQRSSLGPTQGYQIELLGLLDVTLATSTMVYAEAERDWIAILQPDAAARLQYWLDQSRDRRQRGEATLLEVWQHRIDTMLVRLEELALGRGYTYPLPLLFWTAPSAGALMAAYRERLSTLESQTEFTETWEEIRRESQNVAERIEDVVGE